jgi:soluble lytic murein transglycosylase-like protein
MDKQERVGKLFNFFVRIVGASRYTKRQTPLIGTLAVVVLGFGFNFETARMLIVDTTSDVRMAASFAAEKAGAVTLAEELAPEDSTRRIALKLTREQLNVVKFIASRYAIEIDDAKSYVDFAYRAAKQYRVDPHLVLAIMSIESSFDPDAQSHAGAQGLMQVLTRVHKEKFVPYGGVTAAYDPESNIKVGAQILKEYLVRHGSEAGALKSYVGAALMDSDQGYGLKVLSQKARIVAAAQGKPIPVNPAVVMPVLVSSNSSKISLAVNASNANTTGNADIALVIDKADKQIVDDAKTAVDPILAEKATDI